MVDQLTQQIRHTKYLDGKQMQVIHPIKDKQHLVITLIRHKLLVFKI